MKFVFSLFILISSAASSSKSLKDLFMEQLIEDENIQNSIVHPFIEKQAKYHDYIRKTDDNKDVENKLPIVIEIRDKYIYLRCLSDLTSSPNIYYRKNVLTLKGDFIHNLNSDENIKDILEWITNISKDYPFYIYFTFYDREGGSVYGDKTDSMVQKFKEKLTKGLGEDSITINYINPQLFSYAYHIIFDTPDYTQVLDITDNSGGNIIDGSTNHKVIMTVDQLREFYKNDEIYKDKFFRKHETAAITDMNGIETIFFLTKNKIEKRLCSEFNRYMKTNYFDKTDFYEFDLTSDDQKIVYLFIEFIFKNFTDSLSTQIESYFKEFTLIFSLILRLPSLPKDLANFYEQRNEFCVKFLELVKEFDFAQFAGKGVKNLEKYKKTVENFTEATNSDQSFKDLVAFLNFLTSTKITFSNNSRYKILENFLLMIHSSKTVFKEILNNKKCSQILNSLSLSLMSYGSTYVTDQSKKIIEGFCKYSHDEETDDSSRTEFYNNLKSTLSHSASNPPNEISTIVPIDFISFLFYGIQLENRSSDMNQVSLDD